jgi:hypothetical protein
MNGLNSKLLKQVSVRHLNISKGREICLKCIRKSADKKCKYGTRSSMCKTEW